MIDPAVYHVIYKSGHIRGDKQVYDNGIGCSIWYPYDDDEETGICFDFPESDIDDIIKLLQVLKTVSAYGKVK